jgi:hypothetical protein
MRRRGFFRLLAALPGVAVGAVSTRAATPEPAARGVLWYRDNRIAFDAALRGLAESNRRMLRAMPPIASGGISRAQQALRELGRRVVDQGSDEEGGTQPSVRIATDMVCSVSRVGSPSSRLPAGSIISAYLNASDANGSRSVPVSRSTPMSAPSSDMMACVCCCEPEVPADIPSSIGGVAIPMVAGGCGDRNDHLARPSPAPIRPNPDASGNACKCGRIGVAAPILPLAQPLLPNPAPHAGIMGAGA